MSVGTTNDGQTRATSRRAWPAAIALAGSLLGGGVVAQVSGIAAPQQQRSRIPPTGTIK